MSLITFDPNSKALKGKTVVLTGGASGIGEAVVRLARERGANVFFGDLNTALGEKVAKDTGATFVKCNVVNYQDLVALFKKALQTDGKVDHAISNAAIYEPSGFFDLSLDLESVQKEPPNPTSEINFDGTINFAHIASVFLRQGAVSGDDKSLTLISSTAGVLSDPRTPIYSATKVGVLGLARSLAQTLPATHGIRVNAVCPSVTNTPLATLHAAVSLFKTVGLPINTATELAAAILGLSSRSDLNRKVLYVEGGKPWDIEEGLLRTMPDWLGESPMQTLVKLQAYLDSQAKSNIKA